ncbi:MAG: hypothetical protein PHU23_04945 [Dehalococcoidales bacterium]|nr:hypothetical protein [Dehalococcoidales bacterium]
MTEISVNESCKMAIDILHKTHDGNDLDPNHLWIVQEAVNGHLNDDGIAVFQEIYESALKGYTPPWFHGIENLLRRQTGYVYWKGILIEHYSAPWCYSPEAKIHAEELARRCRQLENEGKEISTKTVVWDWK